MCCSHHVGRKFYDEVTDCKKKCSGLISGIDWTLTEKKGEKGFNSPAKKTTAGAAKKTTAGAAKKTTAGAAKKTTSGAAKKTTAGAAKTTTQNKRKNKKTGRTDSIAQLEKLARGD
jgi:hypothetical protein